MFHHHRLANCANLVSTREKWHICLNDEFLAYLSFRHDGNPKNIFPTQHEMSNASANFVLNLVFWKALVWVEGNVFTVHHGEALPSAGAQSLDKKQVTLLCSTFTVVG